MGTIFDYLFTIIDFIMSHLSVIMWAAILFCGSALIAGFVQGGKRKTNRKTRTVKAPSAPRMGLIAQWKDEQRRMDEETFCALDDDEETEDEETDLLPGETSEPLPDDADEDEAFSGIDREKEAKRLHRVLEGLYNKRDKLEYMGVKKSTQRWRGLEYDIEAAERRLAFFED